MISGPLSRALATVLLAAAGGGAWAQSSAWQLRDVLAALAVPQQAVLRFEELTYAPALDRPVRSEGELRFVAPDRLEKIVHRPRAESLLLIGDEAVLRRGERERRIALAAVPEAAALAGALRAALAGDAQRLTRDWQAQVDGDRRQWSVRLTPRVAELASWIREVRLSGAGAELRRVEIEKTDGVYSSLSLRPALDRP